MKCPACGSEQTAVRETRRAGDDLHRRRVCRACPAQWWTAEVVLSEVVVKSEEPAWWTQARSLRRQKLSKKAIAKALDVSRPAVDDALSPKIRERNRIRASAWRAEGGRDGDNIKRQMRREREHVPQS